MFFSPCIFLGTVFGIVMFTCKKKKHFINYCMDCDGVVSDGRAIVSFIKTEMAT